ncbi:MAG: M3 family metallopeptidase [Bacillota bacterium]|nr:M3 family metallopeptidase [Bacillota bacterium]
MNIRITLLTCLILTSAALMTSCSADKIADISDITNTPADPDSVYSYVWHADVPAGGVSYSGYDASRANIIIEELEKYAEKPDPSEVPDIDPQTAVPLLVDSLLEETDKLYTQLQLLYIDYYRDANDEEISELTTDIEEKNIDVSDRALQVLRDVMKGPYGSIVKKDLTKDQREYLRDYEDMTKEEQKLYKEESDLVQKYDKLSLNSADYQDDNKKFVNIFKALVSNRSRQAELYDYDSFADYAYENLYARDYTADDAAALYDDVKKYIVPLYVQSVEDLYEADVMRILLYNDSGDDILKAIDPYIEQIDPQLNSAFNYLRRHHMYDLDASPTKMDVGYTVDLPQYGAQYIFNAPYEEAADYSVAIHEFGHFNAGFHQSQHSLFSAEASLDIAEIQSQGLELLFLDYYDELFGQDADLIRAETLSNMLSGVVTGCMYDEFQQVVFADPDMSRKEINRLAARLSKEYGLTESGVISQADARFDWVSVPHTFESPMYYISYATSALSALDIWTESLDDRDAAIDKYMDVSALSLDTPYLEGLEKCGLRNIFEEGTVKDIANQIEKRSMQ